MNNVKINYERIIETISEQFSLIKPDGINIKIENEQDWLKEQERDADTIYIVVHFGDAATNFGQAILPLTLEVVGIQNEVDQTQALLMEYVEDYNRMQIGDEIQLYNSPSASLKFNQIYEGWRTLFTIEGTILIGNNTIRLETLTYYWENPDYDSTDENSPQYLSEVIDVIAYNDTSENNLNPQPYPNTAGRTKSYGNFQTFAFSIVTYPDGTKQLIQDIMKMKFGEDKSHANDTFLFSGIFAHSNTNMPMWSFKCKSVDFNQKLGDIPVFTLGFSL